VVFSCFDVPILIICRDRLTPLVQLVNWLESAGYRQIVLVDNASTYPALLEYLDRSPHRTIRFEENLGHRVVWEGDVLRRIGHDDLYVVTDCDILPDAACPANVVDRFAELLLRYGDVDKVGFGLRIDDLPDRYAFKEEVRDWESQFWQDEVEPGVYRADIDTTFALYRPRTGYSMRALRTGPPFVARHLPWYGDSATPSDEEVYYREHMAESSGNWDREALPPWLQLAIELRRKAEVSGSGDRPQPGREEASGLALDVLVAALKEAERRLRHECDLRREAQEQLALIRSSRTYRVAWAASKLRQRMRWRSLEELLLRLIPYKSI
jgi:glycosyltransferase involved in cell wall biosynthesis